MAFTKNQIDAIESRGNDVLVSAAAGSGKTTVLVERIIRRIMDNDNPVDIDRILVLTFTKPAAANMREKILKEIEKKIALEPLNSHLARQAMLVQNAQISTFHSFCQEIIKNHFYEIDIDPQLRVLDEAEGKLMKMDALQKVLEDAYEEADDSFIGIIESYTGSKSDSEIENLVMKLYDAAQSHPYPEKWLKLCEEAYDITSVSELKSTEWFDRFVSDLKDNIQYALEETEKMILLCDEPCGPAKYRAAVEDDIDFLTNLSAIDNYDDIARAVRSHDRKDIGRITAKDGVDEILKKECKDKRDSVYKIIDDIKTKTSETLESEVERMMIIAPLAKAIISLVRSFQAEFSAMKADNGVMDFNDMEHLAIKALQSGEGSIADDYRDRFVEIYVDEYQDSNLTQEEIISLIGRSVNGRCGNVFMVGDVKQSIYRFRMARPDLFRRKYKTFSHDPKDGEGQVIDLSDNFRSREEVLDAANEIFSGIMCKNVGGIEYDEAASLHYGKLYDEHTSASDYKAELVLAVKPDELSRVEAEAYAIAQKIDELVGNFDVVGSDGVMRKADYSDIVILQRGLKGRDTVYKKILAKRGIPVLVTTGVGYFSSYEIETILSFLAVIDNPLQDIPLATVMRSYIGGFSDDDLAVIRTVYRKMSLYESIMRVKEEPAPETEGLADRINDFLKLLKHYREESEYLSVYEILREIIDGPYGDYIRSSRNGLQADANLNMLLKRAEDFGKLSYKGLFHFLRYIDQIKKYEIDYGEAGITDETAHNVRIMTMHKSKGLEFPIVFVAGLDKKRNTNDEIAQVIVDNDYGIGLNHVNVEARLKRSTLIRDYMISNLKSENIAEEIRVLYVALTRAQEKLYMVGVVEDADKEFFEVNKPILKCNKYLELLAHVYHEKDGFDFIDTSILTPEDLITTEVGRILSIEDSYYRLNGIMKVGGKAAGIQIPDRIRASLDFEYPYAGCFPRFAKTSVSELKRLSMEESHDSADEIGPPTGDLDFIADENNKGKESNGTVNADRVKEGNENIGNNNDDKVYVPDFIRASKEPPKAGTFYGTAFHKMLELWDYSISHNREMDVTTDEIDEFFARMQALGKIDAIQLEAVNSSEIRTFLRSDIAIKMGKADSEGRLYREQPFVLGVGQGTGMMLVQGIIDAYWIEDDGIVILDYKTDRVNSTKELSDRYHVQLEYYRDALARLTDLKVKSMIIYSARLKATINIEDTNK